VHSVTVLPVGVSNYTASDGSMITFIKFKTYRHNLVYISHLQISLYQNLLILKKIFYCSTCLFHHTKGVTIFFTFVILLD